MRAPYWGPPIAVLPLLAREEQALVDVLTGLDPGQWATPTARPGRTVHDLAAHVLGVKLGRLSRDRDGHRVPESPDAAEAWVTACRRLSPEVLFTLLVDSTAQLADHWGRTDLDEPGAPVAWAGPEPAPRWLDAAAEYSAFWTCQQEIREAVDLPLLDAPEFRGPVVDTFMRALPHTLREVEARTGRQVAYTVTGRSGGRWTARREAGGWTLDRAAPTSRSPLAAVTTDADTFWRLSAGLLRPSDVTDRVTLTGDENVCAALLGMTTGL
ncbi:maleylpyruvate isomerase family mycothiol-dependent enzyme [Amycolatopsis samaneae]